MDNDLRVSRVIAATERSVGTLTGKAILDAGCGIGLLSEALATRGANVTGVDFSPTALVEAAHRVPNGTFHCASLDGICWTEAFDAVVCMDVLFHVVSDEAWRQSLRRMAASLTSHGWLIIQEMTTKPSDVPPHVRWRSIEEYRKEFRQSDMLIFNIETYPLLRAEGHKSIIEARRQHSPR